MKDSKKCSRCLELKNYSQFHKNRQKKDGLNDRCKTCRSSLVKDKFKNSAYKQKKEEQNILMENGLRKCSLCKFTKSIEDFYIDIHKKDGYRNNCKNCDSLSCRNYRSIHKEKVLIKSSEWRNANRDHLNKKNIEYRKLNKERIKKSKKDWEINNPERHRIARANRSKKQMESLTSSYVKKILKETKHPITPETIELKRNIILIKRISKNHGKSKENPPSTT